MANEVPMTTGIKQDKTNSPVLPLNLNQELCDLYLRCPECHFEKSLKYNEEKIIQKIHERNFSHCVFYYIFLLHGVFNGRQIWRNER